MHTAGAKYGQDPPVCRTLIEWLCGIVEDSPTGYPRFSSLIGAGSGFSLSRRFAALRARLLLAKQDEISLLECQLNEIDREETSGISLGSFRRDRNDERKRILANLDTALARYGKTSQRILSSKIALRQWYWQLIDEQLERNYRILALPKASKRNIKSVRNWVEGNGCIVREETAFLDKPLDLVSTSKVNDDAILRLESQVEALAVGFCQYFGLVRS